MLRIKSPLKKKIVVMITILTLAAFGMFLNPSVKADSSQVKVLSYNWYVAPSHTSLAVYIGDLVAVGEVQNVGSTVISYVYVKGVAYNSSGGVLNFKEHKVFGNNLLPGQKAPFYIDFTPENSVTEDLSWISSVSNVTVSVSYVSDTSEAQYSGLTIPTESVMSYIDSTGAFTVIGTVQNMGNEAIGDVWVCTTFYDVSGGVVGLNFTNFLTNSIMPGGSAMFIATPTDNTAQLSSKIANYSLLVQSQPLATSPPSPSTSPSPKASSTQNSSTNPAPSSVSVPSWLIYAMAGVIVVLVIVVASLLLLRMRHKRTKVEQPISP